MYLIYNFHILNPTSTNLQLPNICTVCINNITSLSSTLITIFYVTKNIKKYAKFTPVLHLSTFLCHVVDDDKFFERCESSPVVYNYNTTVIITLDLFVIIFKYQTSN